MGLSFPRPSDLGRLWQRTSRETDRRAPRGAQSFLPSAAKALIGCVLVSLLAGCAGSLPTTREQTRQALTSFDMTEQAGWKCFEAGDPALLNRKELAGVTETVMGKDTLEALRRANVAICFVPQEIKDKKLNPNSVAAFYPLLNALVLPDKSDPDAFLHEGKHGGQQLRSEEGLPFKQERLYLTNFHDGHFTKYLQTRLGMEAGAFAQQALFAKQRDLNGDPAPWLDIIGQEVSREAGEILEEMMKKDPSLATALKDEKKRPDIGLVDLLTARILESPSLLQNYTLPLMEEIATKGKDAYPEEKIFYTPRNFSLKETQAVTVGTAYPKETALPHTQQALNVIGSKLEEKLSKWIALAREIHQGAQKEQVSRPGAEAQGAVGGEKTVAQPSP